VTTCKTCHRPLHYLKADGVTVTEPDGRFRHDERWPLADGSVLVLRVGRGKVERVTDDRQSTDPSEETT
jgi:hypothetical protein